MINNLLDNYKLVLGLEIHMQPKTRSKMFCTCKADVFDSEPNSNTCPVCLGLPGALPVPNLEAVKCTQILGFALNCNVEEDSKFDRKHYFYPDLPKGYQISQYKQPLCTGGHVVLSSGKIADIERIHLEEDTAKSFHNNKKTLIDFNTSGLPLIELVTKPIFTSVEDAVEFCKFVQNTMRDLGISDVDMEKGQMRLEPNISLRTQEMEKNNILPSYKVEIKNINSFKFMEKAVLAEIKRQKEILDRGETPKQENRGYIEEKGMTVSQRSKEEAHDYRYFPEPDIPPMLFSKQYLLEIKREYSERFESSPTQIKKALLQNLDITENTKQRILNELSVEYIKKALELAKQGLSYAELFKNFLNKKDFRDLGFEEILSYFKSIENKINDEQLLIKVVQDVISENQEAVRSYINGKENALQFLIGMVMRNTKGQADISIVKDLLMTQLKK